MGVINFFMQMNPEAVAAYPESHRAIIEGRPAWAFAIAVFCWRAWLPSAPAQEVGVLLFFYRVATRCNCDNDPYAWRGRFYNRLWCL